MYFSIQSSHCVVKKLVDWLFSSICAINAELTYTPGILLLWFRHHNIRQVHMHHCHSWLCSYSAASFPGPTQLLEKQKRTWSNLSCEWCRGWREGREDLIEHRRIVNVPTYTCHCTMDIYTHTCTCSYALAGARFGSFFKQQAQRRLEQSLRRGSLGI